MIYSQQLNFRWGASLREHRTNRQDSRFAQELPEGRGPGTNRVNLQVVNEDASELCNKTENSSAKSIKLISILVISMFLIGCSSTPTTTTTDTISKSSAPPPPLTQEEIAHQQIIAFEQHQADQYSYHGPQED